MAGVWAAFGAVWARMGGAFDAAAANPNYAKMAFAGVAVLALALLARNAMPRNGDGNSEPEAPWRRALPKDPDEESEEVTRIGYIADKLFLQFETLAYIVLGVLLAVTIILGITGTGAQVMDAALGQSNVDALVYTVDRMLFVLMVVEILRTVRDSFRSGTLVAEPFLIVGLIASIRRVLVITLESSQASRGGQWTPQAQLHFNSSMQELLVLGGLILVMVISVALLRFSRRFKHMK